MGSLTMDPNLMDFLSQFKTPKDVIDGVTHVTIFPSNRYSIPVSAYEQFVNVLCEAVSNGHTHCIAENIKDMMPVIIKLKLVYDDMPDYSYSDIFVWKVVSILQQIMFEQLDIDPDNPVQLTCCVLEQDNPEQIDYLQIDGNYVYRLELFFPYAKIETSLFTKVLQPLILSHFRASNIVRHLSREPINSWEQGIDFHIAEKPVVMYGGIDVRNSRPLFLTRVYHRITQADIDDSVVENQLEHGTDDIRLMTYEGIKARLVSPELFETVEDVWHWLPVFFSTRFTKEITMPREQPKNNRLTQVNVPWSLTGGGDELHTKLEVLETRLLRILSERRFAISSFWLDIGRGLFHVSNGDTSALEMWKRVGLQRKIPINTHGGNSCDGHWQNFDDYGTDGVTDLTIRFYAFKDNPHGYREWRTESETELFDAATSCTDDDVAKAFHFRFPFEFVYSGRGNGKDSGWWVFDNHRWVVDDEGMEVTKYLAENFPRALETHRTSLAARGERMSGLEKQNNERLLKQLGQLLTKLKGEPFKNRIVSSLRRHYMNKRFANERDENVCLTVCNNGVIETCSDGSVIFREGKPEDYCTKSTKIRFPLTKPEAAWRRLEDWINQLFIDPNKPDDTSYKTWMAYWRASLLKGGNREKLFVQMFGETHTAKSLYEKLLFCALGDYAGKGENGDILFNPRHEAGKPAPFLSRAQGTRLMFFDELDSRTPLDAGAIRKQSGGDSQANRDLFQGGKDIKEKKQQYRIACTYNKEPPINDGSVDAFWERIAVTPFKTKWSFTPPPTAEEQRRQRIYKRDMEFENQIKELAPAMLWQAVHDFPNYFRQGLPICHVIIMATMSYRAHSDLYLSFIKTGLREDPESQVSIRRMYNHFRSWFIAKFPSSKPPSDPTFQKEMAAKRIQAVGNAYIGWELMAEEPDVDLPRLSA